MKKIENFSKFALSNDEIKNVKGGLFPSRESMCYFYEACTYTYDLSGDYDVASACWASFVSFGC